MMNVIVLSKKAFFYKKEKKKEVNTKNLQSIIFVMELKKMENVLKIKK